MLTKLKRIWHIQNAKNKNKIYIAIMLLFFSSIFDLIGVASVLPFLLSLSDPVIIKENFFLKEINSHLNLSDNDFIIFLALSSFMLIIINQLLRLLSKWYSLALSEHFLYENSRNLFHYYLKKPYEFFLDKNSAHLLQRCTNYVNSTVGGYITPSLLIFGNLLTGFLILFFLIIYNPLITIILLLSLSFFYLAFFYQIKKQIAKFSLAIPQHYSNTAKTIGDAFGSIKDSIMSNNSNFFLRRFILTADNYKNAHIKLNLINQLPSTFIEIFSYGLLISIFLFLFLVSDNFYEIIPLLGITTLSLKRLLPAVQDIYVQLMLVKFYKETYKKIIGDLERSFKFQGSLEASKNKKIMRINFDQKVQFKNVKFYYKTKKNKKFLFNTQIQKGKFIGICGMSGHGKTTFVDLFCSILSQTSGEILVDGIKLQKDHLTKWKEKISYVPQTGYLLNDTILNNVTYGTKFKKDLNKLRKVFKTVELYNFFKNNKYGLSTKIGEDGIRLSGGQQQRLIIARALYQNPEILVLDEATSGLDQSTAKKIIKNIKTNFKDLTIILVSHRVEALDKCNKIFLFKDGKIYKEGKYSLLIKNKYFNRLQLERNY